MTKRVPPWWQWPTVIVGGIAMLTASGTAIVQIYRFITVVDRVEASEQKNAEQDQVLNKLGYIAEQNAALLQQLAPSQGGWRETDADGQCWTCPLRDRPACFDQQRWERC